MYVCKMTAEHIGDVVSISAGCFGSEAWSETAMSDELSNPNAFNLVCIDEKNTVVAFGGLRNNLGECYVTNIAVRSDFRRQGAASAILTEMLDYAKKCNALFLTLEVRKSNISAQKLYEAFGFSVAGHRKNFYTHPTEDAVIMTKWKKL